MVAGGAHETDLRSPAEEDLSAEYEAYRRRQARALVRLMPREAVRPLYRRALRTLAAAQEDRVDPLDLLVRFCETLLPLPPFEVWQEDRTRHRTEHLRDLATSADAPTARAPVTLESRSFPYAGQDWIARLRSFRDDDAWRGYVAFGRDGGDTTHHTALIFRESDPTELRERFLSFDSSSLGAFLRSTLP